jgi:ATP-dependent helicase YprA (DUF1998 family)
MLDKQRNRISYVFCFQGLSLAILFLTLKDFLDYGKMRDMVSGSLAFVSIDATLANAKIEMEKVDNCQDVFVTDNGDKNEPVRGWLTNSEIAKHSQA